MADPNASPEVKLDKAIDDFRKLGPKDADAQTIVESLEAIRKHEQEEKWKDPNPKDLIDTAAKQILAFGAIAEEKIEHGNARQQAEGQKELAAVDTFIKGSLTNNTHGPEVLAERLDSTLKANAAAVVGDKVPEGGTKELEGRFENQRPDGSSRMADALFPVEQALRNTIDPEKSMAERLADIQNFKLPEQPSSSKSPSMTLEAVAAELRGSGDDSAGKLAQDMVMIKGLDKQIEAYTTSEKSSPSAGIEQVIAVRKAMLGEAEKAAGTDLESFAKKVVEEIKNNDSRAAGDTKILEDVVGATSKSPDAARNFEKALHNKDFSGAIEQAKQALGGLISGGQAQNDHPSSQQSLPKVAMATVKSNQLGG